MAKEILCGFGIDVDAVAGWLGSYGGEDSPDDISRGLFAGEVGSPRLLKMFERLGIMDAMRPKALLCINGDEVVDKVAAGEAEIGSTFLSEIVPRAGMTVVGPLPSAIGNATAPNL